MPSIIAISKKVLPTLTQYPIISQEENNAYSIAAFLKLQMIEFLKDGRDGELSHLKMAGI